MAAFPDAQIVQVVRDGRDVVAGMLRGPGRDVVVPAERGQHRHRVPEPVLRRGGRDGPAAWTDLSPAGKCALRWRWAIRQAARLRRTMPDGQLKTLRYEDMVRNPGGAAAALSEFTGREDRRAGRPGQPHGAQERGDEPGAAP